MKKFILIAVFGFGCGAVPEGLDIQTPEFTPDVSENVAGTVLEAPRPILSILNEQKLKPERPPISGPATRTLLQCATDGLRYDFTGQLFSLRMAIGSSKQDFTGLSDGAVYFGSMHNGSRLAFTPVDESAGIELRTYVSDDGALIAQYTPRGDRQTHGNTGHLEGLFLGQTATVRLREVSEGRYSGTLNNHFFFDADFQCWAPETARAFNYNPETGDGHCVNMSGWTLNGEDFSYPNLAWDVQGSDLSGASISFADMIGADFRGAKLGNFSFGYTTLQGPVDSFTGLPDNCGPADGEIDCLR
jgi:hypothetical protein